MCSVLTLEWLAGCLDSEAPDPVSFSTSGGRQVGPSLWSLELVFLLPFGVDGCGRGGFDSGVHLVSGWWGRDCLWEAGLGARPRSEPGRMRNACEQSRTSSVTISGLVSVLPELDLFFGWTFVFALSVLYVNGASYEKLKFDP